MKKHIPIIILFLLFCIEVSSQTLIPFSGSNSVACGTNTTLCTHAGCGATYSNNANGYTVLNAIAPATITISGSYSTEANYDYIRIYAGVGTGGTLLATYHGSGTINYTGTAGQTLTVSFTSDGSVTSTGLNASVTYGGSCGGGTSYLVPSSGNNSITTCSGTIQDHAGNSNYANSVNGFTVINPSTAGNMVRLTFNSFALECCCDAVTVYNGSGVGGTQLFSGNCTTLPPVITSTLGPLTVQFTSDGSVVNTGFSATISCVAPPSCIQPTPYLTVNAPTSNSPLTISTCTFAGEYNTIDNVVAGQTYSFSSSIGTDYLTLTNSANSFLTSGTGTITWTANFTGTVRLHVSLNSSCATQASCRTTTVTCTSCPPPCTTPTLNSISVNSNCWIGDDRHTYTITASASSSSGIGGSTYGILALVNFEGANAGNYGGYFGWNTSLALLDAAGYTLDQCEAAGGGYVGKYNGAYGSSTITLVSGSTSVSGSQRTVNFVVRPNGSFPVLAANDISLYAQSTCGIAAGWLNFDLNFSSQSSQAISCPSSTTVCGAQAVSYSTPTATCNTTVVRNAGLASGSTFPLGVNTVTYNTFYPNGAGGYFNYAQGATNQQIALAACESVYGVGNCSIGACGSFTYYYQTGTLQCNCSKPVGSYEFIYSNTGYTYVGEDYGGTRLDNVSGNQLFTRVKTFGGCSTGPSWTLAEPALGQGGASCSFNVNVTANPTTANAGPDQNVCATSATLAANTPSIGTGSWSIISGAGGSVTTPTSPTSTFTGVAGTSYTLRWTISNAPCAASTDDVVIILTANPTVANAGSDQNVCATSATLAANTPSIGTGSWSIISGAGGSVTTPTSPTSNFTGVAGTSYTLRWTISNAPCTASTDDVIITLTANPTTANAGPDQNVCATSATLAANTPSIGTGAWSIISGAGGSVTTPTSPTSNFTGVAGTSYTLRWTISNAPCADSTDDVIIILTANPTTATAGPDQNVCATSATLAANTPSIGTGAWSIISGAGGSVTTPTSPTSNFTGVAGTSYTLRWTIFNAPCTASTDDVIITLTANPTTANAGPDQNVCATSATLAANTPSIGTGAWSIISGAGGSVTTPTSPTSTFTGVAGTSYTLRWTISNAPCAASTDDVIIILTANPTVANAGPDQNVCATSATLAANTPSIGTGAWSIISGAGGSVTTPTSPTSTFTGVAGTSYTLRWTISNAPCADSTDDVIIILTANPTTATAGSDQNVCATGATLAGNTPSIGTGSWSIISGAGGTVTTPTSPTSNFTGVAGTSYTLRWTISNAPCADSTDDVVITINTQSVAPTGATGTTTICDGGNTTLIVAGGSLGTGAVVEWFTDSCGGTSAGTGNSITVSPTTTTTYYVRYNGTCNTTTCATVTVTVNTLSVAASSVSGASTICNGGSAALTLSGGSLGTGATWQWYSGSCGGTPVGTGTSITVTPSATTTYFVRAEGTCNTTTCPSGATVTVVSSPTITSQPNSPAAICAGATSSNITVVATGGTPSLTYQWEYDNGGTWVAVSNGTPTGASYSGGTSPSMAVTLANASNPSSSHQYRCVIAAAGSGCASVTSDVVTVTVYALPQITSSTSSLCEGATRTLQSDIAVVTWTASGCPTCITGSNIFTAPDPGGASANYTITASNNGCYGPASSYVQTVYDAVNADAGTNQTQCNNGTFTLAGNTPPAYPGIVAGWTLISGTATITTPSSPTSTVTGVPEGSSATLQWTIFNGSCTSSSTVILANNRAATANAGTPQTICAGGTVTLAGSIGGSATSSTWTASSGTFSNASSLTSTYTPSITNGTVTLTLTTDDPDGAGPCGAAIATVIITVNERPSVTTSVVSVGCFGGSNGSATANVIGGTPAYTYSWNTSPTQSTQTATNLLPGTYTVTVTDQNGCSSTAAAVVSEPSMPLNATSTFVNETCNQLNNGSIDVSVSGGTSPYTYIWSNGANTQDLNPVAAGTYVVTITDNNGCVTVLSQTITQPSLLAATITPTNETCNELNNGTATVNVTGGSVPIAYLWSTSATTVSISSLSAGAYSVTVTDTNGCTASATTLITQPDVLTINAPIVTNESCSAANNGSIAASVNGGTTAYTYTWSNAGGNVPTISDLDAGTYSLTVTDINSCATTVLGIVVGSSPTPSITVANSTSICAGGVANLVASVTNPDAMTCGIQWQSSPDGSSWSNISGATGITYTSSALSTTTYYRAIYDCSTPCDATSNTAVITVNAVPSISVSGGTSVCVGGDATLTATPAGGANGCSIQWESSPNGTTWTPIPGANATTYTTPVLSVTTYYHATYTCGGGGCATATSASATVTVTLLPIITIHDN